MKSPCPICQQAELELFYTMGPVPVMINVLSDTREAALNMARGDIRLGYCSNCGHIFNTAFDSTLLDYGGAYDNSLHFSPVYRHWAQQLAVRLIESCGLKNRSLIEVGCGKADFLKLLCNQGPNTGIGYDPSIENRDWFPVGYEGGRVKLERGFFGRECTEVAGDFLLCQHVLEHIENPIDFAKGLRDSRRRTTSHGIYYEVPNGLYTLRDLGVWDLIYEHCSYFSPRSLACLLNEIGYECISCKETFGGQFLSAIAQYPASKDSHSEPLPDASAMPALIAAFRQEFESKLSRWGNELEADRVAGRKVIVWGAGSKGISFLNLLAEQSSVEYVVDLNPSKRGKFLAGTGQEIVSPEFLSNYDPDKVIVMNPNYFAEISDMLGNMGWQGELVQA